MIMVVEMIMVVDMSAIGALEPPDRVLHLDLFGRSDNHFLANLTPYAGVGMGFTHYSASPFGETSFLIPILIAVLHTTGCLWPLDTLGVESKEYERESLFREPVIEDDRIEDFHGIMAFDESMDASAGRGGPAGRRHPGARGTRPATRRRWSGAD